MSFTESQSKVNQDSGKNKDTQNRWSKTIIIRSRKALPNPIRSPVKGRQGIDHHHHRHECENTSRDPTDPISKVQETNGEGSEEDGKVEPGEEGTFVGKEDFGFDADGEGDTLSGGCLEERLG